MISDFLDTKQTADLLGVTTQTLFNWRMENKGPAYQRIGKRILYHPDDLNKWLALNHVNPLKQRGNNSMYSDYQNLGPYYRPWLPSPVDSILVDTPPNTVVEGRIRNKFKSTKDFENHSGGLSEIEIKEVISGTRKLNNDQIAAWCEKLELPRIYLFHWFGKSE